MHRHSAVVHNYSALTHYSPVEPRPGLIHRCPSVKWHRYLGIKENTYLELHVREEQPAKDGNERGIRLYGNELC
jgi:hypothetical protein